MFYGAHTFMYALYKVEKFLSAAGKKARFSFLRSQKSVESKLFFLARKPSKKGQISVPKNEEIFEGKSLVSGCRSKTWKLLKTFGCCRKLSKTELSFENQLFLLLSVQYRTKLGIEEAQRHNVN